MDFLPEADIFGFLLNLAIDGLTVIKNFANDFLTFLFTDLPFLPEGVNYRGIDLIGVLALAFIAIKIASDIVIPDGGG